MLFFKKGYLNDNEEKAVAAVEKITDQEKLLAALKEIRNGKVIDAAVSRLDEEHLIRYIRGERKDSACRVDAIRLLKNQEELLKIVSAGDDYGIFEKEAAIGNLDEAHADAALLKKVALQAEGAGFGIHAKHGMAAVKKISDEDALLEIATGAKDGMVALEAAQRLKDRDKIMAFLMATDDDYDFQTVLKKIELTAEEKQKLAEESKLRDDDVMKELFTEEELYEQCVRKKDKNLAKAAYKTVWDREKLETLKEILESGPEADAIDLRLKTIWHMENLKQKGFPAEINERTVRYNETLGKEISLLGTVKHTVEQQGATIGFDDVYEKSGDALSQAVADRTRLVLTYFLGGPLLGGLMILGPDRWLSENAKDAVWMVIASLQLSDTENVMNRVSADMSEEEAKTLIHDLLKAWWNVAA